MDTIGLVEATIFCHKHGLGIEEGRGQRVQEASSLSIIKEEGVDDVVMRL